MFLNFVSKQEKIMTKIRKKEHIYLYFLLPVFLFGSVSFVSCKNKASDKVEKYSYSVIAEYPHDMRGYTQGLFVHDGMMYESVGQYGQSELRKVDIKTGKVIQKKSLDARFFAEGSCALNGKIYQLTWREKTCFVYDLNTFEEVEKFTYSGEGWGLTTDGKYLIMSDGSSILKFLNPENFAETKYINVTYEGHVLPFLNELEYIDGEIWANVYLQDYIVRINPANGKVIGIVLLHDLLPRTLRTSQTDVLNGIAYDADTKQIYVTGKNWLRLYEINVSKMSKKK